MKQTSTEWRLTVYLVDGRKHHRERVDEVVARAVQRGISGVTVFEGIGGFGRGHHLHEGTLWHQADEMPLMMTTVDNPTAVAAFADLIEELLPGSVCVVDQVEAIRYRRSSEPHHRRWSRRKRRTGEPG